MVLSIPNCLRCGRKLRAPKSLALGRGPLCHPWKSPHELYLEKRGELVPEDISKKQHIIFGHLFEDVIAQGYEIVTGNKVQRRNDTIRHKALEWAFAHIDRKVVGEPRGLECKNVGAFNVAGFGPEGSDQVPDYMLLQCQWYLWITGYEFWDLAALMGGNDLRIYTIRRDDALMADLLRIALDFWRCVEDAKPPELTWDSDATTQLLKRLYPGTNGMSVEASAEIASWHEIRVDALKRASDYEHVAQGAANHIRAEMGEAAQLLLPDGSFYARKMTTRKAYSVAESTYLDFRHRAAKKEKT